MLWEKQFAICNLIVDGVQILVQEEDQAVVLETRLPSRYTIEFIFYETF